jgi:hypothetical protein
MSTKRKDASMWSRAFDLEMKSLSIKGHIRDKKDIQRFKIREFSKVWEEQLVSYDVIYDSSDRFFEPTCYIILSEHQGVMGSHNAILSIRQESEKNDRNMGPTNRLTHLTYQGNRTAFEFRTTTLQ